MQKYRVLHNIITEKIRIFAANFSTTGVISNMKERRKHE